MSIFPDLFQRYRLGLLRHSLLRTCLLLSCGCFFNFRLYFSTLSFSDFLLFHKPSFIFPWLYYIIPKNYLQAPLEIRLLAVYNKISNGASIFKGHDAHLGLFLQKSLASLTISALYSLYSPAFSGRLFI